MFLITKVFNQKSDIVSTHNPEKSKILSARIRGRGLDTVRHLTIKGKEE